MLRNLLVLPDGTEIFSGPGTVNAIESVKWTQRVNEGEDLTLGSVCAGVAEIDLFTPGGTLEIPAGAELTLYKVDAAGTRTRVGLFTVESAIRPSANRYQITAYDRVRQLDRDLSQWLENLDPWPTTLYEFAQRVCMACGLVLANESIPNGELPVQPFTASGVTGRQLMKWVGQAAGRFCRATDAGDLELAFYTPNAAKITPGGVHFAFLDSLSRGDYQVAPIEKVVIRADSKDVGVAYGTGSNCYVITGNPLLTEDPTEAARVIYEILQTVTYTPCRVTVPATTQIGAGDILQVTDGNGRIFTTYVMSRVQQGQRDTLECTGTPRRDGLLPAGGRSWVDMQGKVLELELSVDGLQAENRDGAGKTAALTLSVEGLQSQVARQEMGVTSAVNKLTKVEQTAEGIALQVQQVRNDGVSKVSTVTGFTFDKDGITVRKRGQEIKTRISEDGMTVYKNSRAVLTANSQGVEAVDLHASTYLSIAGRCRFEKYRGGRVGCFWIGG